VTIAAGVLFALMKSLHTDILLATFQKANGRYLAAAAALLIPNLGVQWVKWHYLLTRVDSALPRRDSLKSLLAGFPLGMMTPGQLGEIGRGWMIYHIPKKTTLTLAVIDKASNLIVSVAFGLVAILFSRTAGWERLSLSAVFLIAGAAAIFKFSAAPAALQHTGLNAKNYLWVFFYSALFYFIFMLQLLVLILSFQSFNFLEGLTAAAGAFLVKTLLPISFGDLGIREGAAVFFFSKISVSAAAAFNAAILLFVINVAGPTLIGLYVLFEKSKITNG
jgi:uncharacterized membrane protein YbhN (UPF0104 family)